MRYREFLPPLALRPFIERFWWVTSDGAIAGTDAGRVFPDGRVEMVFNFADPLERLVDGHWTTQPDFGVVGQLQTAVALRHVGRAEYLGVRFSPAGANAFFGLPVNELMNAVAPLDALSGRLAREVSSRVDPEWTVLEKVAALEEILFRRLGGLGAPDPVVAAAAGWLSDDFGADCIADVADRLGISQRTLERKFLRIIGFSPKQFARVSRFQAVYREVEFARTADWADCAVRFGYHDQSHLIRDFREFAGTSPDRLFRVDFPGSGEVIRL